MQGMRQSPRRLPILLDRDDLFDEFYEVNDNRRTAQCGPVAQLGARFHGMEEVIGSIPIRSTKSFNHLEAPPFRDFVASLSQIPKPLL